MANLATELMLEDLDAKEGGSGERFELIDGVAVAMTGASRRHNRAAGKLYRLLDDLAGPEGCETYIEGTRLQLADDTFVYPDVMVTCESDTDDYTVTAPCLVVEVLSPSTGWVDHGRKRTKYLALPSLKHYLLVNIENQSIEHYFRVDSAHGWSFEIVDTETSSSAAMNLTCPKGSIAIADVFQPQ